MAHPERACRRNHAKVFSSAKEVGFPPAKTRMVSYRVRCWMVKSAEADNPLEDTIASAAVDSSDHSYNFLPARMFAARNGSTAAA